MKDLGLLAAGVVVFGLIVFGAVTAGAETSDGSNTRNGVMIGPELPEGITADANRLEAPSGN